MESLILAIRQKIASEMPELTTVEEYYGQLETTAGRYGVRFPCAFVEFIHADWKSAANRSQQGEITLEVTLAFDCKEVHKPWGVGEKGTRYRFEKARELNALLHGSSFGEEGQFSTLTRVSTHSEHLTGNIRVFRHTYRCVVNDTSNAPVRVSPRVEPGIDIQS